MAVVLPDELIAEVLSFLPVKSLVQFRCVSKSWKFLISDPTFVKLHLKRSASRNPLFTLVTHHYPNISGESTDDDNDEGELDMGYSVVPYSLNSLVENPTFTLSVYPYYYLRDKEGSDMVGSCNGLILLAGENFRFGCFRLWNPSTRTTSPNFGYFRSFYRSFPGHPFPFLGYYKFNFGCDNSTGTYNPFEQESSNVRILSFGDNVWREIQSFPVVPYFGEKDVHDVVYLSSTLNWLAIHNHFFYNSKNVTVEHIVIVSLDLGTETYS